MKMLFSVLAFSFIALSAHADANDIIIGPKIDGAEPSSWRDSTFDTTLGPVSWRSVFVCKEVMGNGVYHKYALELYLEDKIVLNGETFGPIKSVGWGWSAVVGGNLEVTFMAPPQDEYRFKIFDPIAREVVRQLECRKPTITTYSGSVPNRVVVGDPFE